MTRTLLSLSLACSIGLLACSEATPPASPRSDVRDVHVHRADDKPDFIRLEREGDPTAAVAAAYVHGANVATSRTIGKYVAEQLAHEGYLATIIPTDAALLVSISVDVSGSSSPKTSNENLVGKLRGALEGGRKRAESKPEASPATPSLCGSAEFSSTPVVPSYRNTVLAAVGTSERLKLIQAAYEADVAWPDGQTPPAKLPDHDEFTTSPSADPAELVVAVRTPLRQRVVPAARDVGLPNSLLSLLAESHDGHWKLLSSHASFVPAGGCLAVHLQAQQPVSALHAARATKAVRRELEWVIAEQTSDEDPRLNVLEAPSAEDAARRAAWEAAARYGFTAKAPTTAFVRYRGDVDSEAWKGLLTAESPTSELPVATRDEHGQGRV